MRVILTVNFSPWSAYSGGGQRSAHELASAHARRGHDVTVVYTRPPWERVDAPSDLPYRVAWAALAGLRSRSGTPLRPLTAIPVAATVRRLVRAAGDGPLVVHAQGEESALVPRLRPPSRFAFVVTPRYPSYPRVLRERRRGPLGRLRRAFAAPKYLLLGAALRAADRWCPTSEASAAEVREAYALGDARCTVVPNGVAQVFLDVARAPDATDGPVVFFGRLAPSKGGDTLIAALAKMGPDAPPTVIVGRGPQEDRLRAAAREAGIADRVSFRGWLDAADLADLLARARMAVLPSREESFGNAMAEAMAAGVPLVSTRVGSVPEVVLDGRTGVLVARADPAALHDAMRGLLADTCGAEAMGRAAREHVRARYSWDATARAFEGVYEEALAVVR